MKQNTGWKHFCALHTPAPPFPFGPSTAPRWIPSKRLLAAVRAGSKAARKSEFRLIPVSEWLGMTADPSPRWSRARSFSSRCFALLAPALALPILFPPPSLFEVFLVPLE